MKLGKLHPVGLAGLPGEEGDKHMKSRQPALCPDLHGLQGMEVGLGQGRIRWRRSHRVCHASCLGCWKEVSSQDMGWYISFWGYYTKVLQT